MVTCVWHYLNLNQAQILEVIRCALLLEHPCDICNVIIGMKTLTY